MPENYEPTFSEESQNQLKEVLGLDEEELENIHREQEFERQMEFMSNLRRRYEF